MFLRRSVAVFLLARTNDRVCNLSLSPERFPSPKNLLSCVVLKNYDDDD